MDSTTQVIQNADYYLTRLLHLGSAYWPAELMEFFGGREAAFRMDTRARSGKIAEWIRGLTAVSASSPEVAETMKLVPAAFDRLFAQAVAIPTALHPLNNGIFTWTEHKTTQVEIRRRHWSIKLSRFGPAASIAYRFSYMDASAHGESFNITLYKSGALTVETNNLRGSMLPDIEGYFFEQAVGHFRDELRDLGN